MDNPIEKFESMQNAVSRQQDGATFRNNFEINRNFPPQIAKLDDISRNFYWSWHPQAVSLFRELAPAVWDKCEQNPRMLLDQVPFLRFWQAAANTDYVAKVDEIYDAMQQYLSEPTRSYGGITAERPVAYFCAEYGVHNSLPIYSGGLGILAGDHLKSASDMNMPLVAVGLMYRFGYFRQRIDHEGMQNEHYIDSFAHPLAIEPVVNNDGERVVVSVNIRGREVFAQAWLAKIGRISLYLLDTHVAENSDVDRLITGHLYGGTSETRIVQEQILGIGGVRLLNKLGITPSVFHLNEGHSAFLTLELVNDTLRSQPELSFADAQEYVKQKCVFTTHTPVAAGNDEFGTEQLASCFTSDYISSLKLSSEDFFALGRIDPANSEENFGMTPFAIRMCRSANGVSEMHGKVSRGLWQDMFAEVEAVDNVPITHITNGVHAPTWIAPVYQSLFEKRSGKNWHEIVRNAAEWEKAVSNLSDEEIWNGHQLMKQLLIAFIRDRIRAKDTGNIETINEHENTRGLLSPDVLTIGFARRVATYKRWNLIMHDLERLLKLVDDQERPVQFVFAGKAHPQDRGAKGILQQLMSLHNDSDWQKRAVFIQDYDQEIARYLVQGVDVWMNVPRRPLEASGTSGQKAAMNGILNFSVLDGWWVEGFNGQNGFAISGLENSESEEIDDANDAEALYSMLENEIIPAYYEKSDSGLPSRWIAMMRNSIATQTSLFSSDRMVADYFAKIYEQN